MGDPGNRTMDGYTSSTSSAWLQSILSSMVDLVFVFDREGRFIFFHAPLGKLYLPPEQFLGKRHNDVMPPHMVDLLERAFEQNRQGEASEFEYELDVGGEHCFFSAKLSPIREEGRFEGAVAVIREITDRKQAQEEHTRLLEQLYHAQKMEAIGRLAGGVAHDFNNLMTGILGYSSLLKIQSEPGTQLFKAADVIEQAANRAASLTRQLLGFARKGKLKNMVVDVHRIIGEVVSLLSRTIDKRIEMIQRLRAENPILMGDPGQIQQVLMNLAMNASDAMPEGGTLLFETSTCTIRGTDRPTHVQLAAGKYLLISVSDTGKGIPDDIRDRIFEPFFTTKPPGEGTGMGLAMVYGIVKNHGGMVQVLSEVGKGSLFNVYFPVSEGLVPEQAESPVGTRVEGRGCILLVEDEPIVAQVAAAMLQDLGYRVTAAKNGREALDIYRNRTAEFDLVILDMVMPIMNGRDCFRELAKIDPHVRVLLTTGHAVDGAAEDLLAQGVLGLLQKPFTIATLGAEVSKALSRKR